MPLAVFGAGLSVSDAVVFAVGLLVGNVPEGLLPVITLALAVGVRELVRRGAVVKRLSAVETLGSTNVICTDKTGTLTENRMRVTAIWTAPQTLDIDAPPKAASPDGGARSRGRAGSQQAMAACNNAHLAEPGADAIGDPTELAMLVAAARLGVPVTRRPGTASAGATSTSTRCSSSCPRSTSATGACGSTPRARPRRCCRAARRVIWSDGRERRLGPRERAELVRLTESYARQGLRVLAVAQRELEPDAPVPELREQAERDLCFLGLVAMFDPPRAEVADAVAACHEPASASSSSPATTA